MFFRYQSILFVAICCLTLKVSAGTTKPIIGIVCHELKEPPDCYIPASYVKAVEAAGARVAPIFLSRSPEYYRMMVKNLNGVVFPGGDASEKTIGGYFQAGASIFSMARKINVAGDHFPILGVCLGFEFIAIYSNEMDKSRTLDQCTGVDGTMLPLHFEEGFRNSSLYSGASDEVLRILSKQNVTANYHEYCLRLGTVLRHPWRTLSTNRDGQGKVFISSMEIEGPMAAIQFHPEKNAFEWEKPHPSYKEALLGVRHFYDWLVSEARKNDHSFQSKSEELDSLIYNYNPLYTGRTRDNFTQQYVFKFDPNVITSN